MKIHPEQLGKLAQNILCEWQTINILRR